MFNLQYYYYYKRQIYPAVSSLKDRLQKLES